MALSFENISYAYGDNRVLEQVNLQAKTGEITCLLGPSGGGKSTLLRLAAGLESLQQGRILLDQAILAEPGNEPAPENRPVGLMFQENALFPHMTIAQNIAYGLQKTPKTERDKIVNELLATVGLSDFGERYPHTLSGGQQQRIALARSLAPKPQVLLMDEPYASIDSTLRRQLREAARQTLKQNGTTTILVTHDPAEAMEMADSIAVLDKGRIVQLGSPQELYQNPVDPTVAALFGNAQTLSASVSDGGYSTDYGLIVSKARLKNCEKLVVRPSGLAIKPADDDSSLSITDIRYIGGSWLLFLLPPQAKAAIPPLRVAVESVEKFALGDSVGIKACESDFFIF